MLMDYLPVALRTSHLTSVVSKPAAGPRRWMDLQHFLQEEIRDLVVVHGETRSEYNLKELSKKLPFMCLGMQD